jgi:hypothetical protein
MRRIFIEALGVLLLGAASAPPYSIQAIRLADSPGDAVAEMVIGAPKDEKIDILLACGSMERVIPGHDALQFQKYPGAGRIANIH